MEQTYTFKNWEFDDFVAATSDNVFTYSQVCDEHSTYFTNTSGSPVRGMICGINGCDKEAVVYVDFED